MARVALLVCALAVVAPSGQRQFTVTPLTTHGRVGGSDLGPAISADGRFVAYVRFEQPGPEVRSEIWLLDRDTGRDEVLVPKTRVEYWGLDFAPDGQAVYATRSFPPLAEGTLVRIRLSDRRIEEVRADSGREPAISPDGRFVAFNRRTIDPPGRELVVAPLDGGPERVLTKRLRPEALNYPSWRSDGRAILFRALDAGHAMMLMEISLPDGRERVIARPEGWGNASPGAWLPGDEAFVVSANQGTELWRVAYPDGALRRLGLNSPDSYGGLISARSAPAIVGVRRRQSSALWIGGPDGAAGAERSWPTAGSAPIWTGDGHLLFVRARPEGSTLVVTDVSGQQIRSTAFGVPAARYPRLSRNGQVMLWNSYAVGDRAFWRTGPNGERPVKVTAGPSDFFGSDVSPDGTWIAYTTWATGRFAVWKLPLANGPATPLIPEESAFPVISPDGRWVAAMNLAAGEPPRVILVSAEGGPPVRVTDLPVSGVGGPQWTADGSAISFVCAPDGVENICIVPRTGGPWRQVTAFTEGAIAAHDWSPGGRLLVVRSLTAVDLVLIEVDRGAASTTIDDAQRTAEQFPIRPRQTPHRYPDSAE